MLVTALRRVERAATVLANWSIDSLIMWSSHELPSGRAD
jgi:hypothetical protein